ncbi:protein root UVB sensitive 5-like [Dendrobium catenatum]|uniref:protein root UVB sensitive 5-like n=1 Tax=Dendrobium catenatum TaxID=906689 RepID=UPI00109F35F9|nr:protein root UVB sensitive 5-like [Dendrobium catenatum]
MKVKAVLELYAQEKHVLFVNRHGSKVLNYYITYKVGATSLSVLKSLWQVYWLHNHHKELDRDDVLGWLNESLLKLEARFTVFLKQLEEAGWQKDQISLKVPKHLLFEEADSLAELFQ